MAIMLTKWMLRGAAATVLLTAAGCSGPTSHEVAPPPDAYTQAPPPELMGAAPGAADDTGLMGGPGGGQQIASASRPASRYADRLVTYRRADGVLVTAMAPVANPEDMSARERRMVYGARYAPRAHVSSGTRARHPVVAQTYYAPAKPRPAAATKPAVVAARPVTAAAPKVVEQAKPAPAPKPAPALAKAPQPSFPATGLAVPADPKLAKLQAAVGGEVAAGSKLTVPEAVTKGQAGQVSLSLPQTLLATIQREAAKLGLTKAAKKAEVTATLSGAGYEITPNGPQTAKLKTGEGAAFNWQVKPGAGERGPLKADIDARLAGIKPPMTFSLASIEQALAAMMPQAPAKKKGFDVSGLLSKLTIPGMKDVAVPGVGRVPSNKVVAGALVLAALALLIALARGVSENRRRAERRRKFRTMTDTGTAHPEPEEHHGGLAAPLAAAAAGAAAGGAIASHHHDEGHGDTHGDHGHDAHAAHDDHGHAADDHGHAAHDDHGHGDTHAAHDNHGHAAAHDDHGHAAHDDHGHAAHDDHGHDAHHKEPEHAH
ncbi:MAG: hypothetical protein V4597_20770 [Pseudomonadota bacterium]